MKALSAGKPIIIVDPIYDLGVVGTSALHITDCLFNDLLRICRGVPYVGITRERLSSLHIKPTHGSDVIGAYVHTSVDAIDGVTTGISINDRIRTIRALVDPASTSKDFRVPGHIIPAVACGDTDFSQFYLMDALQYLSTEARIGEGVVIMGVLDDGGSVADSAYLRDLGSRHDWPVIEFTTLVKHKRFRHGWQRSLQRIGAVEMDHLRMNLLIASVGSHRIRETLPLAVFLYCIPGHIFRECCPCSKEFSAALERFNAADAAAVAIVDGRDIDSNCTRMPRAPWSLHGIARLVAAELSAAEPVDLIADRK